MFEYLSEKILKAKFKEQPFKHIEINNLFSEIDFAEIDILRDKNSKKIYIIDVNKTPIGPPLELNLFEKIKVITVSSSLFIKNFCN